MEVPAELVDRFPEYKDQISHLLKSNKSFMEIVDDYRFCLNKLIKFTEPSGKNNPLRQHYLNTIHDLEEDMMEYFET